MVAKKKKQREHPTEKVKSQYAVKEHREEGERRREFSLAAEVGETGERERERERERKRERERARHAGENA